MKTLNTCFGLAVLVAIVLLGLVLAVVPGLAQNAVPPTAREAAASPAFASKLHPATPPAMSKPRAATRARTGRASPQDQVIYENGPVNGTVDAWTINFGYVVANSFTLGSMDTVTGFDFYVWAYLGDTPLTVDWSITSAPFGGTTYGSGTAQLADSFVSHNQYDYNIREETVTGLNVNLSAGTYFLNLKNASTSLGDLLYWDENSGAGCNSPGCPSLADQNAAGTIASEAFDITGIGSEPPPPPCFGSGGSLQIIRDFTEEDRVRNAQGVTIDRAGNLFGTAGGGDNNAGLVYELSPKGQGWVFSSLYSFLGGSNGSGPSPVIVGPDAALYGTASGGIPNCGWGDCGLVFSLRPGPTACLTASCPWTESVLYQPTGNNDAYDPGNLVFDQAGNLYGTSGSGGAYGNGAIFELTPSNGGWKENIIYSFPGGSDGYGPGSLLMGNDGNFYGTANSSRGSIVFQLVPSGGAWTENVIYTGVGWPTNLVQDGFGNLYGISYTQNDQGFSVMGYMLSPSNGSWVFSVIYTAPGRLYDPYDTSDLSIDAAGNLYAAIGHPDPGSPVGGNDYWWGAVMINFGSLWYGSAVEFFPNGPLAVDAGGNVYGTTFDCGRYDDGAIGTIWKVTR